MAMQFITVVFGILSVSVVAQQCDVFKTYQDDKAQQFAQEIVQQEKTIEQECLHLAVKNNLFQTTEYLMDNYFSKDDKRFNDAMATARNAVTQVRNKQNDMLDKYESLQSSKNIPVIQPAFRWAQSLNNTYLEVKFATRFDSPACLDIFDTNYTILDDLQTVYISAMCRNDKKLMKYEITLDLYECVHDELSYFESESVGRLFVNLHKLDSPIRWKSLLRDNKKLPNMGIWWELLEKYEKELEEHSPDEDESESDNSSSQQQEQNTKVPKTKKSNKKKKNTGKQKEQPKEQ